MKKNTLAINWLCFSIIYLSCSWATCWPVPVSRIQKSLRRSCDDSFCQLGNSVSLPWVIYYGAFYLHVLSSFSFIPAICLKLVLFLFFCNLCICFVTDISILFSFRSFSNSSSFTPSPPLLQVVYLNHNTFFTSVSSFKENLSGFFPWDLPVVKISPEWVTGPEQVKSSGRIATFSLWTGVFRDGISTIPDETVIPPWLGRHFLVCENKVYHEKVRMTVA